MVKRKEIVEDVAMRTGVGLKTIESVFDSLFESMRTHLCKGEEIDINKFGKLVLGQTSARQGHNPQNGAKIQIPSKTVVRFKPSKALKDAINK